MAQGRTAGVGDSASPGRVSWEETTSLGRADQVTQSSCSVERVRTGQNSDLLRERAKAFLPSGGLSSCSPEHEDTFLAVSRAQGPCRPRIQQA